MLKEMLPWGEKGSRLTSLLSLPDKLTTAFIYDIPMQQRSEQQHKVRLSIIENKYKRATRQTYLLLQDKQNRKVRIYEIRTQIGRETHWQQ